MRKALWIAVLLCVLIYCLSPDAYANAPGPNLDGASHYDGMYPALMTAVVIFIYLMMIAFTCWMEWLIAGPFGFRASYQKTILITNLITQLCMHISEFCFLQLCPRLLGDITGTLQWYLLLELVLEILVYITEYLIYCRKMPDVSRRKVLRYTVCANTASLLGGILLLIILI